MKNIVMDSKECQFCYSQIPEKATKCKFCMEWQEDAVSTETEVSSEKSVEFSDRFPTLRKLFQLRIVEKIPLHYAVSVLIFGVIIFATIQFLWYRLEEDNVYLLSFLTYTLQMMVSWSGLIWIYNVINDNYFSYIQISALPNDKAEKEFIKHHNKIFNYTKCILVGVFVGAASVVGEYMVGTPFVTLQARIIYSVFAFVNMFFAGAGLYSMLTYAIFVHDISASSKETSSQINRNDCIANIGKVHLKTCVIGIAPLCLGVLAKMFGDWSWELRVILWYSSFAVVIILYIYWPMLNIHFLMKQDVERQTSLIQRKLRETLIDVKTNQSVRSIISLNELKELEKSILSESTWPFDPKNISAIFSAIGFPILLMLFEKFWPF